MKVDLNRKRMMSGKLSDGSSANVNALVNQFQLPNPQATIPPSLPPKRDPKRMRSGANTESNGKDMETENQLAPSAASLEEDRRAQ
jgi:hypothetical protein